MRRRACRELPATTWDPKLRKKLCGVAQQATRYASKVDIFSQLDPMTHCRETGQFTCPPALASKVENVTVGRFQVGLRTGAH
jgi:hypothetical protein